MQMQWQRLKQRDRWTQKTALRAMRSPRAWRLVEAMVHSLLRPRSASVPQLRAFQLPLRVPQSMPQVAAFLLPPSWVPVLPPLQRISSLHNFLRAVVFSVCVVCWPCRARGMLRS